MLINCFTFSPFCGFVEGIEVVMDAPHPDNSGRFYAPHIRVGGDFLQIDTVRKPVLRSNRILMSSVRRIDTERSSFKVLSQPEGQSILVMVDLNQVPANIKRRIDPSVVNAWVTFDTDAEIQLQHNASGKCLVEFSANDQALSIFDRDGAVYRVTRRENKMVTSHLTPTEMARERVILMKAQLQQNDSGLGRQHGILSSAVRLLQVTKLPEAREILIDFLRDYAGENEMPDKLRKCVCGLLRSYGNPSALMFSDGFHGNIVPISKNKKRTVSV